MGRFALWVRWLQTVGLGLTVFGIIMAFFNATSLFAPFNRGIDPVFWGGELADPQTLHFRAWVYGAWGATIAGWGVSLVILVQNAFSRREKWAWYAIAAGLALWYALDTGISAYFQVTFNVIFNTIILLLATVPLVASFSAFRSENPRHG